MNFDVKLFMKKFLSDDCKNYDIKKNEKSFTKYTKQVVQHLFWRNIIGLYIPYKKV